jgi:uncharacterized SAM-binding protein YcdF (DUF218 family)
VGFARRHPLLSAVLLLLLLVVGVVGGTGVAVWRAAHQDEASRIDHVDVIAVLGAAEYDGRPSPVFQGRLEHVLELYRHHFSSTVLTLGGKEQGDVTTEADAGRTWLLGRGMPESSVYAERKGSDTLRSLQAAASFMQAHGMRSVFLVSDPWHNLRIRRMGRDLGLQAYVSATWTSAARSHHTRLDGYVRETFGYIAYRLLGR